MFKDRPDLIDWNVIAVNPSKWACEKINQRVEKRNPKVFLDLYNLFLNPSDWAGELIQKHSMTPVWYLLSSNPAAIKILSLHENKDKLEYKYLSKNPEAIKLIKQKIIEEGLLSDEAYKEFKNKIDPRNLSQNPSIFII